MFKYICSNIEIFPQFLDLVFSFGQQSSSGEDNFTSFYKTLSFQGQTTNPSFYGKFGGFKR
jgi:hypothetical protein